MHFRNHMRDMEYNIKRDKYAYALIAQLVQVFCESRQSGCHYS